ncbi:MAG: metallophosphoesterase [Aquihabitans sp.]
MSHGTGYDVIGDIHGHATKLVGLLGVLGYTERSGVWRHPDRQAVFVGDLVDRGPEQLETIEIVRAMVDAGSAQIVMGNHEFNAIAFATPDPDQPGEYLRRHSNKNISQHSGFLGAVYSAGWGAADTAHGSGPSKLHREILDWFRTIPLWLDLDGLRVAHACWDETAMADLRSGLTEHNTLTEEGFVRSAQKQLEGPQNREYDAIETLLKGPEIAMGTNPETGKVIAYFDKEHHPRRKARLRWWDPSAITIRAAAVIPTNVTWADGSRQPFTQDDLPDVEISETDRPNRYHDQVPVLVGHYWETGEFTVYNHHVACVDYSAGKGGPLAAYRWSGEPTLTTDNFVSFDG